MADLPPSSQDLPDQGADERLAAVIDSLTAEEMVLVLAFYSADDDFLFAVQEAKRRSTRAEGWPEGRHAERVRRRLAGSWVERAERAEAIAAERLDRLAEMDHLRGRAEQAEARIARTRRRLDALITAGFGATTDTLRELRAALSAEGGPHG